MTQYNSVNVKLYNSQLDKLGIKNGAEVTLNISSNVIGNSLFIILKRLILHINFVLNP